MPDHTLILARFPRLTWDEASKSILVPQEIVLEVAQWLKDERTFALDYISNVTGVDYLPAQKKEKQKQPDGTEVEVATNIPGRIDVVYHLFSMRKKHGPIILKQQALSRENPVVMSLTTLFRGAELQEREVYDLFGVRFTGHPDLRRLLMWDEFQDYPMRKDYREPDDYEYEPTPHGEILAKAKQHYPEKI